MTVITFQNDLVIEFCYMVDVKSCRPLEFLNYSERMRLAKTNQAQSFVPFDCFNTILLFLPLEVYIFEFGKFRLSNSVERG